MIFRDILATLFVVLFWGFNFVIIKWGVEDINPTMMTLLRFFLTAVPAVFFIQRPNVPFFAVALYGTLFGVGVWSVLSYAISIGTPAGLASLLLQSATFLSVLVGVFFFREKLSKQQIIGLLFAVVGFALIVVSNGNGGNVVGVFLVLLSAVALTTCNAIVRHYQPKNVFAFVVWSSLFVPLPLLIIAVVYENGWGFFQLPNWQGWVSVLIQSLITTLIGWGIWVAMIAKYDLSTVTPYSLLVPISGLFFAWLLYGEILNISESIGAGLVIIGLLFNAKLLRLMKL